MRWRSDPAADDGERAATGDGRSTDDAGGSGTAPTPVDHFLGSLASRLAVTTRSQAQKYDADEETVERIVESAERICTVSNLIRDDVGVDVVYERS